MKDKVIVNEDEQKGIKPINISTEMQNSFLSYAMSVIASRALPDARDGLKPVHRRIIYAMNDLGMHSNKPYKKSARIVGEVIGKYHPHGDSSVYEAMVRMAQDFSQRYMLVNGHGNFGSVDGDGAAAMRYTEARMSKVAMELVKDINKDTINYRENYDGQEQEPAVLPARFPNLLANGTTGIAVGMATNIPPHNLREVIEGVIAVARNPEITIEEISQIIQGPDFPKGGIILGKSGIDSYFRTGNGSVKVRAKYEIEKHKGDRERIIVTEIPYQVNKARLVEKIAYLVRQKVLKGISDLRDETSRKGLRIVIEVKKDESAVVVMHRLFKLTPLQSSFGVNMLALVGLKPKVLNIKETLVVYLEHQMAVIQRRTRFELNKAEARAHILEGLTLALNNIDAVIETIKSCPDSNAAQASLIEKYGMSKIQAKSILEMKLSRLTGLEADKIKNELNMLEIEVKRLKDVLESKDKQIDIIEDELRIISEKFGDDRRSEISLTESDSIDEEDMIEEHKVIITVTNTGYAKRIPLSEYRKQNRGGVGSKGITTKDDDVVEHTIVTSTHTDLLFFTNKGRVYRLRAHEIVEGSKTAKGKPLVQSISKMEKDEKVEALIKIDDYENQFLFFATKKGLVKKVKASEFTSIRVTGKIAIKLNIDDDLVTVRKVRDEDHILLGSSEGKVIRFPVATLRAIGRSTSGVRGMNVSRGTLVGAAVSSESKYLLSVSENGYGKLTLIDQYRVTGRGGKGVISLKVNDKIGELVNIRAVKGLEDLFMISDKGISSRISLKNVSVIGRQSMGVKLIKLKEGHKLTSLSVIPAIEQIEQESEGLDVLDREMSTEELEETAVIEVLEGDDVPNAS